MPLLFTMSTKKHIKSSIENSCTLIGFYTIIELLDSGKLFLKSYQVQHRWIWFKKAVM